jgi:hypothetical protein
MIWAAVRDDLLVNALAILELRAWLAAQPSDERWTLLSELTDLRLLDVLAWSLHHVGGFGSSTRRLR